MAPTTAWTRSCSGGAGKAASDVLSSAVMTVNAITDLGSTLAAPAEPSGDVSFFSKQPSPRRWKLSEGSSPLLDAWLFVRVDGQAASMLCQRSWGFPEMAASDKWRLRHPDEATAPGAAPPTGGNVDYPRDYPPAATPRAAPEPVGRPRSRAAGRPRWDRARPAPTAGSTDRRPDRSRSRTGGRSRRGTRRSRPCAPGSPS